MRNAGNIKHARRIIKITFLVIGSIAIFLLLNNCSNIRDDIYNIQDPSSSYQYIFNQHGILKARHNPNQLILFDPCLKKIQLADNIAFNYPYEITGWKNDTIELSLLLSDPDWDFYKQKYYRIRNYSSYIGKYFIRYSHKPVAKWITVRDTIDSIRMNVNDFTLQTIYKGIIKDNIPIINLWFSERALEYKTDDGKSGSSKKIQFTNALINKDVLENMISNYQQAYCK